MLLTQMVNRNEGYLKVIKRVCIIPDKWMVMLSIEKASMLVMKCSEIKVGVLIVGK